MNKKIDDIKYEAQTIIMAVLYGAAGIAYTYVILSILTEITGFNGIF